MQVNLLKDFDKGEQAIINPFEFPNKVNGFPERLVPTFTRSCEQYMQVALEAVLLL